MFEEALIIVIFLIGHFLFVSSFEYIILARLFILGVGVLRVDLYVRVEFPLSSHVFLSNIWEMLQKYTYVGDFF